VWVVLGDELGELSPVVGNHALEPHVPAVLTQPGVGFVGGRAGKAFVVVPFDHHREVFAAGQGLFGFNFRAEPGRRGAKWCRQVLELSEWVPLRHVEGRRMIWNLCATDAGCMVDPG
jgi:hypothetical protein